MIKGKNTKVHSVRYPANQDKTLVVGKDENMQFNPNIWRQWQEDACDADAWKHGRTSAPYRENYDRIFGG